MLVVVCLRKGVVVLVLGGRARVSKLFLCERLALGGGGGGAVSGTGEPATRSESERLQLSTFN
jgi:hypothetical protein